MQSIAIISDIHGNLQALTAVLAAMKRQGVDQIYCIGDLVGKGPNPVEVVDILFACCDKIVRGNWDELVCKITDDIQFRWHADQLGATRLAQLSQLPFSYDFILSGRHIRLLHASPQSIFQRVQSWDEKEKRLRMFEFTSALTKPLYPHQSPDVVIYGDVHQAYLQYLQGHTLVNCGSVGNPLDITQASYVIIHGHIGQTQISEYSLQFHRIPYPIEQAVRAAEASNMPGIQPYVRELCTGVYRGLHHRAEL